MSFDNIELSKQTVQLLFSKSLVESIKEQPVIQPSSKIDSLGKNKKNILFLVNDPGNKFLPDNQMDMLSNLISACNLSMDDIALVNYQKNSANYKELTKYFSPQKILIFGVSTAMLELPFTIPFFQIQLYNSQSYIIAPPLKNFIEHTELKKELWTCLKKLFLLSK